MRDIDYDLVDDALGNVNLYQRDEYTERGDENAVKIWPNTYSGRGMFGDRCFGIEVEHIGALLAFIAGFTHAMMKYEDDFDEGRVTSVAPPPIDPSEFAMETRTDNMGRQIIAYWPGYQLVNLPAELRDEEPVDA